MNDPLVKRDSRGRIVSGSSGNPGGRPKAVRELLDMARASVPKALALAAAFMDDDRLDPRIRLESAKFLASYGLGTPHKQLDDHNEEERRMLAAMSDLEIEDRAREILSTRPLRAVRTARLLPSREPEDATIEGEPRSEEQDGGLSGAGSTASGDRE